MRALWSQIPRPRLGGSPSLPNSDPCFNILVRKTTTAPLRRRLTFGDAFTLLLTPVLATAFIVDTSWKEKQRKDWDQKLAEVLNEIDQLKARELRVCSSLQLRTSSGGHLYQRRHYSASAGARVTEDQDAYEEDEYEEVTQDWHNGTPPTQASELSVDELNNLLQSQQATDLSQPRLGSDPISTAMDWQLAAAHRHHRLIATMLAVRLLTHLQVSTSYRFIDQEEEEEAVISSSVTDQFVDIGWLVRLNQKLKKELREMRRNHPNLQLQGANINKMYQNSALHLDIKDLIHDFTRKRLDAAAFFRGYAKLILNTDQVPCTQTYVMLLNACAKAEHWGMAYFISSALKNSTLPLTDNAVSSLILHYGKNLDSQQMESFFRRVISTKSPHNVVSKWKMRKANGILVPVPSNLNSHILQALVHMALRCHQPDRGEAWFSILQDANFGDADLSHLSRSFLQQYSANRNWEAGIVWLRRCVHHATSIVAAKSLEPMQRVILRMLDLCVACNRLPEYTMILNAAVNAGFTPPAGIKLRRTSTPRIRSILREWEDQMPEEGGAQPQPVPESQKILRFQQKCNFSDSDVLPKEVSTAEQLPEEERDSMSLKQNSVHDSEVNGPSTVQDTSTASEMILRQMDHMQALLSRQQEDIADLKRQLELAGQPQQLSSRHTEDIPSRDQEHRELMARTQEQVKASNTTLDRLHEEQQARIRRNALLESQLTNIKEEQRERVALVREPKNASTSALLSHDEQDAHTNSDVLVDAGADDLYGKLQPLGSVQQTAIPIESPGSNDARAVRPAARSPDISESVKPRSMAQNTERPRSGNAITPRTVYPKITSDNGAPNTPVQILSSTRAPPITAKRVQSDQPISEQQSAEKVPPSSFFHALNEASGVWKTTYSSETLPGSSSYEAMVEAPRLTPDMVEKETEPRTSHTRSHVQQVSHGQDKVAWTPWQSHRFDMSNVGKALSSKDETPFNNEFDEEPAVIYKYYARDSGR